MKVQELIEDVDRDGKRVGSALKKGPQHSYIELADEFGITQHQLSGLRKAHPGFPEPSNKFSGTKMSPTRTYFDVKLAREWFKTIKKPS